ncbi:MAG: hypothetical protein PHU08_05755 [Dehalococcoidales bacterium]|nr:hypothetical protein [Dehalococcoidales bacterium]
MFYQDCFAVPVHRNDARNKKFRKPSPFAQYQITWQRGTNVLPQVIVSGYAANYDYLSGAKPEANNYPGRHNVKR